MSHRRLLRGVNRQLPSRIGFAGSSEDCTRLPERLQGPPGVARITLQPRASKVPEGVLSVIEAANRASTKILSILSDLGLRHTGAVSIRGPNATPRAGASGPISEKENDSRWEEIGAR